jgi:hypothetical protein
LKSGRWLCGWKDRVGQGTPVVVPTQANIRASTLNKGGSGDPSAWSIVSYAHVRTGGI